MSSATTAVPARPGSWTLIVVTRTQRCGMSKASMRSKPARQSGWLAACSASFEPRLTTIANGWLPATRSRVGTISSMRRPITAWMSG